MNDTNLIIVGNDYSKFAALPDVYTLAGFLQKAIDTPGWPAAPAQAMLGQGLSGDDRAFLAEYLAQRQVRCSNADQVPASLQETHKHSVENVLITRPRKLGERRYACELVITDKIDRLSDHVTGRHVGAMLLMEAARQATIVAIERSVCVPRQEGYGLILKRFDANFGVYLFPLPATLVTEMHVRDESASNLAVSVVTTVSQGGSQIAELTLDLTLCPQPSLDKVESRLAQTAFGKVQGQALAAREPALSVTGQ